MIKYTLIVNSRANSGRAKNFIQERTSALNEALGNPNILYADNPSQIHQLVQEALLNSDCIIACGGDGTMQSVARALYGRDCLMGVIPIGSGNDFVKALGIAPGKELSYYLNIILKRNISQVDIPVLNDDIFINTSGIGFDGLTNYLAAKSKFKGSVKYLVSGFKAFLTAKQARCEIQAGKAFTYEGYIWMVAVANGHTEGGKYKISPSSDNADGILELVIVPAYSRIRLMIAFLFLSLNISLSNRFFHIYKTSAASIRIDHHHHIHLDGEIGTASSKYEVRILDEKLAVIGS